MSHNQLLLCTGQNQLALNLSTHRRTLSPSPGSMYWDDIWGPSHPQMIYIYIYHHICHCICCKCTCCTQLQPDQVGVVAKVFCFINLAPSSLCRLESRHGGTSRFCLFQSGPLQPCAGLERGMVGLDQERLWCAPHAPAAVQGECWRGDGKSIWSLEDRFDHCDRTVPIWCWDCIMFLGPVGAH